MASSGGHSAPQRLLYGNLVSSPHILRNLQGRQGIYFLFPDVSIRCRGRFLLNVTLIRLPGQVVVMRPNLICYEILTPLFLVALGPPAYSVSLNRV